MLTAPELLYVFQNGWSILWQTSGSNISLYVCPFSCSEVIKSELKQFEEHHVWPLTVIAPLKEFGNIPGFRDYSPEEVRYQYYEAVKNNTLFDFVSIKVR